MLLGRLQELSTGFYNLLTVKGLFHAQLQFDIWEVSIVNQSGVRKIALTFCSLFGQDVALKCMLALDFATSSDGESLLCTGFCFHFRHLTCFFCVKLLYQLLISFLGWSWGSFFYLLVWVVVLPYRGQRVLGQTWEVRSRLCLWTRWFFL